MSSLDKLIETYFQEGYAYKEILALLYGKDGIKLRYL